MARILYIEDDDDSAFMLSRRLKRRGFDVTVASDAKTGLALVRKARPDLILIDLGLPGDMDGWEATRRLRAEPATRTLPIVAVSSHAMSGDRERALAVGCNDYDTKPIEFARLLAKIESLLARESG